MEKRKCPRFPVMLPPWSSAKGRDGVWWSMCPWKDAASGARRPCTKETKYESVSISSETS